MKRKMDNPFLLLLADGCPLVVKRSSGGQVPFDE